jgi:hypothetical protein
VRSSSAIFSLNLAEEENMEKVRIRRTQEQWLRLIEEWRTSNMPATAWCHEHNIPYDSFIIWRKRLKGTGQKQSEMQNAPFVELADHTSTLSGIEIRYRSLSVVLSKNFDPSTLIHCLQALGKVPC